MFYLFFYLCFTYLSMFYFVYYGTTHTMLVECIRITNSCSRRKNRLDRFALFKALQWTEIVTVETCSCWQFFVYPWGLFLCFGFIMPWSIHGCKGRQTSKIPCESIYRLCISCLVQRSSRKIHYLIVLFNWQNDISWRFHNLSNWRSLKLVNFILFLLYPILLRSCECLISIDSKF